MVTTCAVDNDGHILVLDYHCNQCGHAWRRRPELYTPICPRPGGCGSTYPDKPKRWWAFVYGKMEHYPTEGKRDAAVKKCYANA